ncbi:MAG: AAA family ATPase [Clostridiales bacterium]|nr:AAA family ATPase [Clostridiales bacterium]
MMQDFYIKEIKLQNYRRFEDKTLQLDKQMNLLIGKNASGKTTILEAVNVALGAYLAAYKTYVPSRFVRNIAEVDVRKKAQKTGQKDVLISPDIGQYPCSVEALLVMDETEYSYRRLVEKMGNRTKFAGNNPMQKEVIKWENAMKGGDEGDAALIFPLVLYLSSARLWNENKNSDFNYDIPNRTDAYHRCLDPRRGMQMPFNYIRHLKEVSSQENGNVDFPAYTLIMEAIRKSMEEELKTGQRIDYSLRYNGLALVEEDGTWIPFDDLSDGYRGVIKIVSDIATRMCILNPYLKEDILSKTPGVVVIDELDLSLHPSWQRRIIRTLTTIFPKVQFICASHSPFLIQALDDGQLISLDGEIEEEYSGQSIEDIAETIMGVRNPKYSEKKQKMYDAAKAYFEALNADDVSPERLMELKEELDFLTAEYSDNPAYSALMYQKYLEKKVEMVG